IAEKGFEPKYGGRSIHRFIQANVKDAVADELLFGSLKNGGTVTVDVEDDSLRLRFDAPRRSKKSKKPTRRPRSEKAPV
ncbi:MAG: hypothetical protein KDD69_20260, partial [Bdellovibrionales bacterium]|nr:hypothetical protein [Bdellovibrionales bacterium]